MEQEQKQEVIISEVLTEVIEELTIYELVKTICSNQVDNSSQANTVVKVSPEKARENFIVQIYLNGDWVSSCHQARLIYPFQNSPITLCSVCGRVVHLGQP